MKMGMLDGKVAVVTGAGGGIGKEVALELARQGAKVVVNDYGVSINGSNPTSEVANQVVEEIKSFGGEAVANANSVAEMESAKAIIETAFQEYGDLDILVCVAGNLRERMIFNMSEEEWDSVINTHLKGHFATMHYATKHMREQKKGRIVTFTSTAGLEGSSGQPNYSAAKAGIVGLTLSTAVAMAKYNVTCNTICPTAMTRMIERVQGSRLSQLTEEDISPRHVAPVVAFLCSDHASHVTGQIVAVKGREISLWGHHRQLRSIYNYGGDWTSEQIQQVFDKSLGQERLDRLERMRLNAK